MSALGMTRTAVVSVLALAAGAALAQQPAAPATVAAADTAPASGPRIAVEPTVFDFGKAQQQKTLEKEFTIRNLGTEDLVIESVSTTCGCTVAEGYAKVIKPGSTTPLRVKLQTRTVTGRLSRSVLIKSNDPSGRPLELKVEATVERQAPTS
jgi:Protein of unknown function (DUF1573)